MGQQDGDAGVPGSLARVLAEVRDERVAQDERWGMQVLPDGTGGHGTVAAADAARDETETAARAGGLTWRHILAEEVMEAFAEEDPQRLRRELIQVAAVAVKWVQALDRRPAGDRPGARDRTAVRRPEGDQPGPGDQEVERLPGDDQPGPRDQTVTANGRGGAA
ncbi:hypothetical protein ACFMQL_30180 [Nonomuraea fastidiosa]|jgi:hypothetical protein|uniref:hypothetical protein n=1 Tax=Nonomuraea TaxID=83681 RepID=UPI00324D8D3B